MMGYMRQHVIVVTSWKEESVTLAHERAMEIFGTQCSNMVSSVTNGESSFFIGPDGSKEGWAESDKGDQRREEFKAWLRTQVYEDGTSNLSWVEVFYGDDNGEAAIVDHRDLAPARE